MPLERHSTKYITSTPQNSQYHPCDCETVTDKRSLKRHDTKCNVSWMGSWNRKRKLGETREVLILVNNNMLILVHQLQQMNYVILIIEETGCGVYENSCLQLFCKSKTVQSKSI